jgi:tRNA pseudouridine38-40 synthase
MKYAYSYLVEIQYLGFRLHGWQKQPNVKTVHLLVDKTIKFICAGVRFKTLGVGRTDAKVSAEYYAFQLFIDEKVDFETFFKDFNFNSPGDMRIIGKKDIDAKFNIIQHPKTKEYRYYFSFGEKNHPYAAPFIVGHLGELDVDLMKEGARLFEGTKNYRRYCTKPTEETKVVRTIDFCRIEENTDLKANFFPAQSFVLIVKGEGFLRNQIRLIMGALFSLGSGRFDLDFILKSFDPESDIEFLRNIAPASGLHLNKIDFKI